MKELLDNIVTGILIPVIPAIAALIVAYLNALRLKAQKQAKITEESLVALRLGEAFDAISKAVDYTAQVYVDHMKDQDAFDKVAQKNALRVSKERAKLLMSAAVRDTVINISGDLDAWLETNIEAKLKELKESVAPTAVLAIAEDCPPENPEA